MLILPYKLSSASAKELAMALGIKRTSRLLNRPDVINWGCNDPSLTQTINTGPAVAETADKIAAFRMMAAANVPTVEWTTNHVQAQQWYDEGNTVYCRTLTKAFGGRGIVVANKEDGVALVRAPLYTKYFKNKEEYRVHVGKTAQGYVVIFAQQKKKRREEDVNFKIRNHENGWVFCTEGVDIPEPVRTAALAALASSKLVFGAIDIGFRVRDGHAAVFEINTAAGITGKTTAAYAEFFKGL